MLLPHLHRLATDVCNKKSIARRITSRCYNSRLDMRMVGTKCLSIGDRVHYLSPLSLLITAPLPALLLIRVLLWWRTPELLMLWIRWILLQRYELRGRWHLLMRRAFVSVPLLLVPFIVDVLSRSLLEEHIVPGGVDVENLLFYNLVRGYY